MSYKPPARFFKSILVPQAQGYGLKARYSPVENIPAYFDYRALVERYSPRRPAIIDHYSRMQPDRLSWRVVTNLSAKHISKAVLRNRLKRRWASAFAEALKGAGYHHNGRRISGPKDGKNYVVGLRGTLEILIFSNRGLTCPHRELVGSSRCLIRALLDKMPRLQQLDDTDNEKGQEDINPGTQPQDDGMSLWASWR